MGQFFRVVTYCQSYLLARPDDGVLVNGSSDSKALVDVLAYIPSDISSSCFLFAKLAPGLVPSIHPLEPVGRILPLRVARGAQQETASLYSPWTGLFLVTEQPDGKGWGHVALAANEVDISEIYSLRPAGDVAVSPAVSQATAALDRFYSKPDVSKAIIELLEGAVPSDVLADVVNAVTLNLTPQEFSRLARDIDHGIHRLVALKAVYPSDLSALKALSDLARWQNWVPTADEGAKRKEENGRRLEAVEVQPRVRDVGSEFDQLDRVGLAGTFISFPHSLNVDWRRRIEPRRRACVVATARDEGLYLLDWVAHHRAIGFEELFIYTNDNVDGSDPLLAALADANEVVWLRNQVQPGTRPQWKAYNHALRMLPDILDYGWSLFIDLDEYFSLEESLFASVDDYLVWQERRSVDAIMLNWAMIGSNGEVCWRDAPLHARFPTGNREPDRHVKCMFRPRKFQAAMPHFPIEFRAETRIFRNSTGELHQYEPSFGPARSLEPNLRYAWIEHFFFKSNEEFVYKFGRGRGDDVWSSKQTLSSPTVEFIQEFVRLADRGVAQNDQGSALIGRALSYRTKLLQNQKIRTAHQDVTQLYKNRIWEILASVGSSPSFFLAGEAGRRLLAPLLRL
jgi:hypothetical protein